MTESAGQTDFVIFLKLIRELRLQSDELAPNLRRDEHLQREQIQTLVYLVVNRARDTGKEEFI